MKIARQRALVMAAVTILGAVCGLGCGYVAGSLLAVHQAKHRLQEDAGRLIAEENASLTETYAALKTMSASRYPRCSEAELAYFRKLLFQTDVLNDGGRMRDGKIDCSATLGPADLPNGPLKLEFSMPGGSKVYMGTGPLQVRNHPTFVMQFGDFYVVINSIASRLLDPSTSEFILSVTKALNRAPGRLVGTPSDPGDPIFNREGLIYRGGSLYFTRCTPDGMSCVTTHATIAEAMRADRNEVWIGTVLGGLLGIFLGFVCSVLYRRSRNMEQQLHRAIRKDKLRLVYQPIVDLASRRIVGAEALARWTDEEGFAVGPDVFIGIAEKGGFVGEITALAARHALRDFAETLRARDDFRLSINVAAADLSDPRFMPMIENALKRAGVEARSLAIEITESSTARHEAAIETIRRLHDRGHSVHIDDFGTGYSSLSYLHALSIDTIKIDKSFTQAIGTDAVTVGILPQILAMAEVLGLQVIVEGVETREQASYFAAVALPVLVQGWLFGRPAPAEAFLQLLAEDAKKAELVLAVV